MTPKEIQDEWDAFIEYPEGSGKLYVTTTSALIFARSIVEMAEKRVTDSLRAQPDHSELVKRLRCLNPVGDSFQYICKITNEAADALEGK